IATMPENPRFLAVCCMRSLTSRHHTPQDIHIMVTPLTHLTEHERAQALERFHLLRPFLEEQVALLPIAHQHHVSLRTLRRWVQRYATEGLTGLVRKRRTDRGGRRRLSPALHHVVEGLALQTPPLSVAVIHRQVCEFACQQGATPPRYSLVYDI